MRFLSIAERTDDLIPEGFMRDILSRQLDALSDGERVIGFDALARLLVQSGFATVNDLHALVNGQGFMWAEAKR